MGVLTGPDGDGDGAKISLEKIFGASASRPRPVAILNCYHPIPYNQLLIACERRRPGKLKLGYRQAPVLNCYTG